MKVSFLSCLFQSCLKLFTALVRENIFNNKSKAKSYMNPIGRPVPVQTGNPNVN